MACIMGIQIYTGTPSEHNGGRWHDIDFKYEVISAAPDAVFACIETLLSTVESPLLTILKSGGLRFSCRVLDYLHPNTKDSKLYIYKHTPIPENPHQRDVYLEVLGENGYSRWDARYEILLGNLLDPPLIPKEVLFAPIDALRAELHEPIPLEAQKLEDAPQVVSIAPSSLSSHNLDLAKKAFLKRGFSYVRQENGFHHWTQPGGTVSTEHVLLWERDGTVWVRASTPDTGLPTETTAITDVWTDSREEVEQVLGCSSRQANRVLQRLRGGKPLRVPLREQILSILASDGEKKASEFVDAIDGHPRAVIASNA